ncbi:hypothetical protein [Qipengyuania sp. ASV99]|uniref:hypothetical protein n=1 Tax=Qipengyuania sp. ASV99 TaxID=3399681 RepID=UPI003A4C5A1F
MLNAASTAWRYGPELMIDYFALALGHGLLAIALLRLVMSGHLDVDPLIKRYSDKARAEREAAIASRRPSKRANAAAGTGEEAAER